MKEVKGYKFLMRNFPDIYWRKEPWYVKEAFAEYGAMLAKERLFFYVQHEQPSDTVNSNFKLVPGSEWVAFGQTPGGEHARDILKNYPNCVSLTGHSHYPINDERSIWQNEYTAVHCGHMSGWCIVAPGRENSHEVLANPPQEMPPFRFRDVHDFTIMSVYDDVIRFERFDAQYDEKFEPDWVVPIGGKERPYSWKTRAEASKPPKFAKGAKITVKEIAEGKDRAGNKHPQIEVSFPQAASANGGDRAYDYSVRLEMQRGELKFTKDEKRVYSPNFAHSEKHEKEPVKCVFPRSVVPKGRCVRFVVTPYNCWLKAGEPLVSKNFHFN